MNWVQCACGGAVCLNWIEVTHWQLELLSAEKKGQNNTDTFRQI